MAVALDRYNQCECGARKRASSRLCSDCRNRERVIQLFPSRCLGHPIAIEGVTRTACTLPVDWGGLPHRHCWCLEPVAAYWQGRCGQCVAEAMGLGRIVAGQGGTPLPLW